ncbi:hypothetical protein R3W88_032161 [Solanum pinnatisectum]|uniref:Uncharacterized protein n=1 Tax=Solanum pinnatisectum TaxID=50273 RepID=A0AAV9LQA5_9SOLN|nr:hypothetical protein R3W88_032161 [Solanum pinnatisectum]
MAVAPQIENAREYLKFVENRFHSADKSLAGILMAELTTMKFDRSRSMQNYIIEMKNIAARLRTLGMKRSQDLRNNEVIPNLMDQGVGKGLKVKANKFKKKKAPAKVPQDAHKELKVDVCRFCRKEGHFH